MRKMEETLERLAEPLLDEMGLEMVDLEVKKRNAGLWVAMFVDLRDRGQGGITVDQLSEFNLAISRLLDVEEPIPESYTLEVSSPGVNRRIRKLADLEKALGKRIKVFSKETVAGRKKFVGVLLAADQEEIEVETEQGRVRISRALIDRANLIHDFEAAGKKR